MIRSTTAYLGVTAALACVAMSGCGHPNILDLMAEIYDPIGAVADRAVLSPNPDVRREGIVELSHRWGGHLPKRMNWYARMAAAQSEEPTVRSVALRALAQAGPDAKPHIGAIVLALDDGRLRDDKGRPLVPEQWRDVRVDVRWDAAVALDSVPADEALPGLSMHVKWDRQRQEGEPSPDVRVACARALRHYRTTDVVAKLAEVLDEDEDYAVRREAHESLVELVGIDRGWDGKDWHADTKKLPPPRPKKPWWDLFGLTVAQAE